MNVFGLRSPFRSFTRYLKSPRVTLWRKLLALFAVVYLVSPVDAVPDVLPILGWLDDVGVLSAVGFFLVKDVRRFEEEGAAAPEDGRVP